MRSLFLFFALLLPWVALAHAACPRGYSGTGCTDYIGCCTSVNATSGECLGASGGCDNGGQCLFSTGDGPLLASDTKCFGCPGGIPGVDNGWGGTFCDVRLPPLWRNTTMTNGTLVRYNFSVVSTGYIWAEPSRACDCSVRWKAPVAFSPTSPTLSGFGVLLMGNTRWYLGGGLNLRGALLTNINFPDNSNAQSVAFRDVNAIDEAKYQCYQDGFCSGFFAWTQGSFIRVVVVSKQALSGWKTAYDVFNPSAMGTDVSPNSNNAVMQFHEISRFDSEHNCPNGIGDFSDGSYWAANKESIGRTAELAKRETGGYLANVNFYQFFQDATGATQSVAAQAAVAAMHWRLFGHRVRLSPAFGCQPNITVAEDEVGCVTPLRLAVDIKFNPGSNITDAVCGNSTLVPSSRVSPAGKSLLRPSGAAKTMLGVTTCSCYPPFNSPSLLSICANDLCGSTAARGLVNATWVNSGSWPKLAEPAACSCLGNWKTDARSCTNTTCNWCNMANCDPLGATAAADGSCVCSALRTGSRCEISLCNSTNTKPNTVNTTVCECKDSFFGVLCEKKCVNGFVVPGAGAQATTCQCYTGWEGPTCEVSKCKNGGVWVNSTKASGCVCDTSGVWSGSTCEVDNCRRNRVTQEGLWRGVQEFGAAALVNGQWQCACNWPFEPTNSADDLPRWWPGRGNGTTSLRNSLANCYSYSCGFGRPTENTTASTKPWEMCTCNTAPGRIGIYTPEKECTGKSKLECLSVCSKGSCGLDAPNNNQLVSYRSGSYCCECAAAFNYHVALDAFALNIPRWDSSGISGSNMTINGTTYDLSAAIQKSNSYCMQECTTLKPCVNDQSHTYTQNATTGNMECACKRCWFSSTNASSLGYPACDYYVPNCDIAKPTAAQNITNQCPVTNCSCCQYFKDACAACTTSSSNCNISPVTGLCIPVVSANSTSSSSSSTNQNIIIGASVAASVVLGSVLSLQVITTMLQSAKTASVVLKTIGPVANAASDAAPLLKPKPTGAQGGTQGDAPNRRRKPPMRPNIYTSSPPQYIFIVTIVLSVATLCSAFTSQLYRDYIIQGDNPFEIKVFKLDNIDTWAGRTGAEFPSHKGSESTCSNSITNHLYVPPILAWGYGINGQAECSPYTDFPFSPWGQYTWLTAVGPTVPYTFDSALDGYMTTMIDSIADACWNTAANHVTPIVGTQVLDSFKTFEYLVDEVQCNFTPSSAKIHIGTETFSTDQVKWGQAKVHDPVQATNYKVWDFKWYPTLTIGDRNKRCSDRGAVVTLPGLNTNQYSLRVSPVTTSAYSTSPFTATPHVKDHIWYHIDSNRNDAIITEQERIFFYGYTLIRRCVCQNGYFGLDCESRCPETGPMQQTNRGLCSNHGECTTTSSIGFTWNEASGPTYCHCAPQGSTSGCKCDPGYYGERCEHAQQTQLFVADTVAGRSSWPTMIKSGAADFTECCPSWSTDCSGLLNEKTGLSCTPNKAGECQDTTTPCKPGYTYCYDSVVGGVSSMCMKTTPVIETSGCPPYEISPTWSWPDTDPNANPLYGKSIDWTQHVMRHDCGEGYFLPNTAITQLVPQSPIDSSLNTPFRWKVDGEIQYSGHGQCWYDLRSESTLGKTFCWCNTPKQPNVYPKLPNSGLQPRRGWWGAKCALRTCTSLMLPSSISDPGVLTQVTAPYNAKPELYMCFGNAATGLLVTVEDSWNSTNTICDDLLQPNLYPISPITPEQQASLLNVYDVRTINTPGKCRRCDEGYGLLTGISQRALIGTKFEIYGNGLCHRQTFHSNSGGQCGGYGKPVLGAVTNVTTIQWKDASKREWVITGTKSVQAVQSCSCPEGTVRYRNERSLTTPDTGICMRSCAVNATYTGYTIASATSESKLVQTNMVENLRCGGVSNGLCRPIKDDNGQPDGLNSACLCTAGWGGHQCAQRDVSMYNTISGRDFSESRKCGSGYGQAVVRTTRQPSWTKPATDHADIDYFDNVVAEMGKAGGPNADQPLVYADNDYAGISRYSLFECQCSSLAPDGYGMVDIDGHRICVKLPTHPSLFGYGGQPADRRLRDSWAADNANRTKEACSGQGTLTYDTENDSYDSRCFCNPGWTGAACEDRDLTDWAGKICGQGGEMVDKNKFTRRCVCYDPAVMDPESKLCYIPCPLFNGKPCGGDTQGKCIKDSADPKFQGQATDNERYCSCRIGWVDSDSSGANDCGSKLVAAYKSSSTGLEIACSGHGVPDPVGNGFCICDAGWVGLACEVGTANRYCNYGQTFLDAYSAGIVIT